MRIVVQRVARASVRVEGVVVGSIQRGLCLLVGVMDGDIETEVVALAQKVVNLRIFEDEAGKMNLSVREVAGSLLAISQFTLAGDVRKGNRPSFVTAMDPEPARAHFDQFCSALRAQGVEVQTGKFRAHMEVDLVNDGPVTILLDSRRTF